MGNTYGILLITVLMGSGLVSLPRRMWYYADIDMELNGLYMMVRCVHMYMQSYGWLITITDMIPYSRKHFFSR